MQNTIFALATGNEVSAISVIRVSGQECERVLKKLTFKKLPKERVLTLLMTQKPQHLSQPSLLYITMIILFGF